MYLCATENTIYLMMWISFALLSALCLGFYDVFKKQSLSGNAVVPVLFVNTLLCALVFVPLMVSSALGYITAESSLYMATPTWEVHRHILLKAIIVLASWLCGYFGIKHLPLTIAGPINSTRPVLTLLGALFIYGEVLNGWQWIGVVLAIASVYLLSRSGRREGIHFAHNKHILLVALAAVLGSTSGLYDKHLLAPIASGGLALPKLEVQGYYNLYQCAMMLIILAIVWWPRRSVLRFEWRWSIPLIALFLTLTDLSYFYAMSQEGALVAVVSMVRRSNVLVSFAIGVFFLREANAKRKAIDLLLVLLSLICLWLGSR